MDPVDLFTKFINGVIDALQAVFRIAIFSGDFAGLQEDENVYNTGT